MSKVGGTVLHVLHSLEPRPPSSSGHAIQNTWSVLAGSANNGRRGRREERGWKAESTHRERERDRESSDQPQLRLPRIVHASFSCSSVNDPWKMSRGL